MDNSIFLPYQQDILTESAYHQLNVIEKARRLGISWAIAGDCALYASQAQGGDVYYKGQDKEMAQTFITDAAWFAKEIYAVVVSEIDEKVFPDPDNPDKDILSYTVRFNSGHFIQAQSSNPAGLRGKGRPSDRFVFDEAAFHPDLKALIKAGMALLTWGCKIFFISTHNGDANPFNELVTDIRAGKRPGKVHRVSFMEGVEQGLYKRICQITDQVWTPDTEAEWVAQMYAYYGDDADEELNVIPSQGSGVVLPRALIDRCMVDADIKAYKWTV
jgi:phage FluMu gp28-like protein